MASAWIMGNFKGINLKVLDMQEKSSIADFFVLGSAGNPTQAAAMAEEITFQFRNMGIEAISREGLKHSTDWILLLQYHSYLCLCPCRYMFLFLSSIHYLQDI